MRAASNASLRQGDGRHGLGRENDGEILGPEFRAHGGGEADWIRAATTGGKGARRGKMGNLGIKNQATLELALGW